jgi:hypothetical protein
MELSKHKSTFRELVNASYAFFPSLFGRIIGLICGQYCVMFGVALLEALLFRWMFIGNPHLFRAAPIKVLSEFGMTVIVFCAVFVLVLLLLAAYFTTAQFARAYGVIQNDEDFIDQTWQRAKERFLYVAGFFFLVSLLFLPLLGLLFFIPAGLFIKPAAGLAVFLLSVYVWIRCYLVLPFLVVFEQGILQAIRSSVQATSGQCWRTAGVLFFVVGVPLLCLGALDVFLAHSAPALQIMAFILHIIGNIVITVLMLSSVYVLFNDYLLVEDERSK